MRHYFKTYKRPILQNPPNVIAKLERIAEDTEPGAHVLDDG